jgi:phosphate transport system protein
MQREHIMRTYDAELDLLRSKITQMGGICAQQLSKAIESLTKRDTMLAEEVVLGDAGVNALNREIDQLTFRILATRQPVAVDLRNIISALKMAADLERIADYAANIAKCVGDLNHIVLDGPIQSILRMAALAQQMLNDILEAYAQADDAKARSVWQADRQIDTIYADLLGEIKGYMAAESGKIDAFTSLMFAARCCERIGDHIKNVSESVQFIQSGVNFPQDLEC